ncbi:MAG: DUF1489 family protein [Rhizobiaceae bacterium]|nr:DUF1489 family protein [Rhizobiaceae bacterium]
MTLHLIKLCVGAESVEDLEEWVAGRVADKPRAGPGAPREPFHITRMVPKRVDELMEGGSLYWVIKGQVQCRQRIVEVRPFTDAEGIGRCYLVLDPKLQRTQWQPRRAFQGWRYLKPQDAPADLPDDADIAAMPVALRSELAELGLL